MQQVRLCSHGCGSRRRCLRGMRGGLPQKWTQSITHAVGVIDRQLGVNTSESRAQRLRGIVVTNPVTQRTCKVLWRRIVL